MPLTLAGRLFHSVGAAIWNDLPPRVFFVFPMGNCNNSSSEVFLILVLYFCTTSVDLCIRHFLQLMNARHNLITPWLIIILYPKLPVRMPALDDWDRLTML